MSLIQRDYVLGGALCPADKADTLSEDTCESDDPHMPFIVSKPLDRFKFVRITFLLMGMSTSLPWNFFVTANDYWMFKFRNVSSGNEPQPWLEKTELQTTFTGYLAITSSASSVLALVVSTSLLRRFSLWNLNFLSLFATVLLFVVTTSLVKVNSDSWQMLFFAITMIIVVILNVVSSVYQSAVLALAASFPPKYIYNTMIGQAVAGVIAAVAQILSLVGDASPSTSAIYYFCCGIFLFLLTLTFYVAIHYTPFYKYYVALNSKPLNSPISIVDSSFEEAGNFRVGLATARKMWPYLSSIFVILFVTLSVFPSVSVLVVSVNADDPRSLWTGRSFIPVCCFLVFNCGDVCGRMFAMWIVPRRWPGRLLLLGSVLRAAFVPLVMLCNATPRWRLPVLLGNDADFVVLMTLMGFTNGYLTSLVFVFATRDVPIHFKEAAGTVISAAGGLGVLFGSLFSVALIRLL